MSAAYAALATSYATLTRYQARRDDYERRLDACAPLLDDYRREHPGGGLAKVYAYLRYVLDAPELAGISRDRFTAGMKARGRLLVVRTPQIRTTRSGPYRFDNQTRGIIVSAPDELWVSDTTYYRMSSGAWSYLTFVLDVFTREIIGYAVSESLRVEANVVAVERAISRRGAARLLGAEVKVTFHSDGGAQFVAAEFVGALAGIGARSSMGFVAQENAFAERVNGTIKSEFLDHWPASRRSLAKLELCAARAIATYNEARLHDGLPGRTCPSDFATAYALGQHRDYEVAVREWNHDPYSSTDRLTPPTP